MASSAQEKGSEPQLARAWNDQAETATDYLLTFGVVQVPASSAIDVFFSVITAHCGAISAFSSL
jgi:hypothetical protein